jgi:hypothetical protein
MSHRPTHPVTVGPEIIRPTFRIMLPKVIRSRHNAKVQHWSSTKSGLHLEGRLGLQIILRDVIGNNPTEPYWFTTLADGDAFRMMMK